MGSLGIIRIIFDRLLELVVQSDSRPTVRIAHCCTASESTVNYELTPVQAHWQSGSNSGFN